MTREEAISKIYKLRNEAYEQLDRLKHPDFMYEDNEKTKWKTKFNCYEEFLEILVNLK